MSLRIDANADYLVRSTNLPSGDLYTIAGWWYRVGTGNGGWETIFSYADGDNLYHFLYGYDGSGPRFSVWDTGASTTGANITNGVWYYVALQGTGSQVRATYGLAGAALAQINYTQVQTPSGYIHLARNEGWTNEWCNARYSNIMIWNAALTLAELEQQRYRWKPVVQVSNLNGWYPMDANSGWGKDYSGNGRDFTEAGTLTREDNPPVSLGAPIFYSFPSAPTGGSSSSSHPAFTAGVGAGTNVDSSHPAFTAALSNVTSFRQGYVAGTIPSEKLVPNSDISQSGNWKNEAGGTSLYPSIDEQSASDSDYVLHKNTVGNEYFEVALSSPSGTPGSGDIVLYFRAKDLAKQYTQVSVELREGTTVIATRLQTLQNSEETYQWVLTAGERSAISNWSNLRVRVTVGNNTPLLSVSGTNPRYFVDQDNNPVYLAGFHTWYDVQDGGGTNPPPTFNWSEYLSALQSYGCNFTKLWAMETLRGWSDVTDKWFAPSRYARTGPGNANDGGLKVDLDQINSTYISRLVSRCQDLESAGIYFVVQLFQGWQIEQNKGGTGDPCTYHPYLAANNIDAIDGDDDNDGDLLETHFPVAQGNNVLSYQEALVEAIIDATYQFNYLIGWEISNEDSNDTNGYDQDWQEYMIAHINTYQSGLSKQHLVMQTVHWPDGDNSLLDASGADFVSYNGAKADAVHSASDPVSMYDTDHTVGLADEYEIDWIWESLCNGHGGSWFMDAWDGAQYGTDWRNMAGYIYIRNNLGYLNTLVGLLNDLLGMTPQPSLSSFGLCIAKNHATEGEYVCYYTGSSTFDLNLTTATGTLNVRWLRCSDGTVQDSATVQGGAVRTLTPPWTGEVVAYVRHT